MCYSWERQWEYIIYNTRFLLVSLFLLEENFAKIDKLSHHSTGKNRYPVNYTSQSELVKLELQMLMYRFQVTEWPHTQKLDACWIMHYMRHDPRTWNTKWHFYLRVQFLMVLSRTYKTCERVYHRSYSAYLQ